MNTKTVSIFTDGSSRGNPGSGGWGAVIIFGDKVVELGDREDHTTNNRMEIAAAIGALIHMKNVPDEISIYTDSSYLIGGITQWVKAWIKNGWTTKAKEEVQNRDLWEVLAGLLSERENTDGFKSVNWKKVSGHAEVPGNERADEIATIYADEKEPELYNGSAAEYPIDLSATTATESGKIKHAKKGSRTSKVKAYSYLSMVKGQIEKHATWAECERRVKGVSDARFKKAVSADDEQKIIEAWQNL